MRSKVGMENTLILAASPRKGGNCDFAAQLLCETAGLNKPLALYDYDLKRCRGCLNCQQGKKCGIKDDFKRVWETFDKASAVVIVAPVYWCGPPGLFKDFIDRTVVFFGSEPMKGRKIHLVSVAQSAGFDPHEKMIETWISWLGGSPLKTKMRLIAFHRGELEKNTSAIRKLISLGKNLV